MNLGKIGATTLMDTKWRNPYVTDGLVAMWDGEWNAGGGIHDPNAKTWTDISGNGYDGVCAQNGPGWEDDCCIILPTTQHIQVVPYVDVGWKIPKATYANLYPLCSTDAGYTIECVAKQTSNRQYLDTGISGFFYTIIETSWYGADCAFKFNPGMQGRFEGDTSYKTDARRLRSYSPANKPFLYSLVAKFDNATTTAYYNGRYLDALPCATIQGNAYGRFTYSPLNSVGADYAGNRLYCSRLYSRALTADEIAANYAVDKVRFNLP